MQEKPLSDSDSKIHWRLNDLLRAGKKAKEFAAVSWSDPKEQDNSRFIQWQPGGTQQIENDISLDLGAVAVGDAAEGPNTLPVDTSIERADIQAAMAKAKEEAFEEGILEGKAQTERAHGQIKNALKDLIERIRVNEGNIREFHDPLKKLAVHIAEQLIRGELTISSRAIERLVNQALEDIENQGPEEIVVTLHPEDLSSLGKTADVIKESIEFRSDSHLSRGSVRVTMGDSAIEDLIERRLQNIVENLYDADREEISSHEQDTNLTQDQSTDEKPLQQAPVEFPEEIMPIVETTMLHEGPLDISADAVEIKSDE
ncbi:MAG: flagellar biosynthesis/type III secretory pathway protein FliH [Porticoccaceae bacterium]